MSPTGTECAPHRLRDSYLNINRRIARITSGCTQAGLACAFEVVNRSFRLGDPVRYPPSKMANQIVERGVESEVLACVSARMAHCFGVLPIASGKHPNTLIVATHRELNSELRINFREITGQQIARQGLAEVGEFFEALNLSLIHI